MHVNVIDVGRRVVALRFLTSNGPWDYMSMRFGQRSLVGATARPAAWPGAAPRRRHESAFHVHARSPRLVYA